MWKRMGMILGAILAYQLSIERAVACSCAPPIPSPAGSAPALRLPHLGGKNSAEFMGIVEEMVPKSESDYQILWRKMYGEDLSDDGPRSVQKMRTFMLHFWRDTFSPAEKAQIMRAKSVDDLES